MPNSVTLLTHGPYGSACPDVRYCVLFTHIFASAPLVCNSNYGCSPEANAELTESWDMDHTTSTWRISVTMVATRRIMRGHIVRINYSDMLLLTGVSWPQHDHTYSLL